MTSVERYYVGKEQWESILKDWLFKYRVLAPLKKAGHNHLQSVTLDNYQKIIYDEARPVQPMKTFLLPSLEEVAGGSSEPQKSALLLGVKACDLSALPILDRAFGGDFADPFYQARREKTLIVSSDCSQPWETCFCTLVGGQPYPLKGFDLNLSKVWDGFIVEVGSLKGRNLLDGYDKLLKELVREEELALQKMRREVLRKVDKQNHPYYLKRSVSGLLDSQWESDVWGRHASTCVECGACNLACPTCHCYFLDDVTRKEGVKLRGWDACLYSGYAVTAGGGTPRPRLIQRFRNRYFCKLQYLEKNYGQLGCTGCGRCIEGCQGLIDMRKAMHELSKSSGAGT